MRHKFLLVLGIVVTFSAMALNGVVMWKITSDWLLTALAALIPWLSACGAAIAISGCENE